MHGAGTTGSAKTSRPSLREWCYGLYVLSSGTGSFAPVTHDARQKHRALGLSTGRPGPHDFTVRAGGARPAQPSRPSQPASTFVTTRTPLFDEAGCGWIP